MNESIRETRVLAWHAAFGAAAAAAALALGTPKLALSILLGAALQTLNFRSLFALAQRAFAQERASSGFALRLPLLGALLFVAIRAGVDAAGLLVGLSVVMPAVVLAAWQSRPPRLAPRDLPALAPNDPTWDAWSPWLAREREVPPGDDTP